MMNFAIVVFRHNTSLIRLLVDGVRRLDDVVVTFVRHRHGCDFVQVGLVRWNDLQEHLKRSIHVGCILVEQKSAAEHEEEQKIVGTFTELVFTRN